jgi:hypothetical protein
MRDNLFSSGMPLCLPDQLPLNVEIATATRPWRSFDGAYVVARPQRLEIRLLGTSIRAEGIAGIIGAIVFGLILITYFRS